MITAYNRTLKSITEYPLPILSAAQAKCLQGIGDKLATMIERMNIEKYKKYLINSSQHLTEDTFLDALKRKKKSGAEGDGDDDDDPTKERAFKKALDNQGVYQQLLEKKKHGRKLLEIENEPKLATSPSFVLITIHLIMLEREKYQKGEVRVNPDDKFCDPVNKIFADQSGWVFKDHVRVVFIEFTQYQEIFKGIEFPEFT
jgi:hypothetical protein